MTHLVDHCEREDWDVAHKHDWEGLGDDDVVRGAQGLPAQVVEGKLAHACVDSGQRHAHTAALGR